MKNMKKILALLLCLTMVLGMFPAAFAEEGIELAGDESFNDSGIEEVAGDDAIIVPENADPITNDDEAANPSDDSVGDGVLDVPETLDEPEASDNSTGDDAPPEELEQMIAESFSDTEKFEANLVASGTSNMLDWKLYSDGLLTISGEGWMDDYPNSWDTTDWRAYKDSIKRVWISSGAASIGNWAFCGCSGLTSVTIPDSVTSIGDWAFSGCSSLTSVTIPDSVTIIGGSAFSGCSSLTSVTIPGGVTSISYEAFYNCSSLTSVTIPEGVTSIGGAAFSGCSSLTSVTIPEGVTSIFYYAFSGCSGLTSVTIPVSMSNIGREAFRACNSLIDVYYAGSKAEWEQIVINKYNEPLTDATIHYNSTGPGYGEIINSGDNPWVIELECPFEDCVAQTASTEYNPNLSYYLAGLARAVYSPSDIGSSLRSLGFDYDNADKQFDDSLFDLLSGYVIAKKPLDDHSDLIIIVIRGSVGGNWLNVVNAGFAPLGTGDHIGFQADAAKVWDALKVFLGNQNLSSNKYVITGHSQGAAASNILARDLCKVIPAANIFCYNFACPNVACSYDSSLWNPNNQFNYIFNIENVQDLVPIIPSDFLFKFFDDPLTQWGKFGREGWFVPSERNDAGGIGPGHNMFYYVRALSDRRPWDDVFFSKDQIKRYMPEFWRVIACCCPVDTIVYDSTGNPVASVINDQACYYNSEIGEVLIIQNGDEKWFYLPNDQDYDVKIKATDVGEMTFKVFDYNMVGEEVLEEKTISSVALDPGKTMVSDVGGDIDTPDIKLYVLNDNDVPVREVREDGIETDITYTLHNRTYTKWSGQTVSITPITDNSFTGYAYTKTGSYSNAVTISTSNYTIQSGRLSFKSAWLDNLSAGTYYLWGIPSLGAPVYLGYMQINAAEMSITVSPTSYTKNDPTAEPVAASGTAIPHMARFGIVPANGSNGHLLSNNEYTLSGSTVTLTKDYLNSLADGTYYFIGLTSSNEQIRANSTFTIKSSTPAADAPRFTVSSATARPGETVTLTVAVENNPGLASFELEPVYDSASLTWTGVTKGSLPGNWDVAVGEAITWIDADNYGEDGAVFTLEFQVPDSTADGDYTVSLRYDPDNVFDENGSNVSVAVIPGKVTVSSRTPGDVNGDDKVNNKDVLWLMRFLKGREVSVVPGSTDINGDGKNNNKDVLWLMRYIKYQNVEIH